MKEVWSKHVVGVRTRHNLSQEDLAERIGTNQATVSRWERRLSCPTYSLRKRIAALYGEPEPESDQSAITAVAQGLINVVGGYGAVLFDRQEICIAASANVKHRPGVSISQTTPPWEHGYLRQWRLFMQEVDFWDTPWATFEYEHESCPRVDMAPRRVRALLTSVVICNQVYCLVHSKSPNLDIIDYSAA